MASDFTLVQEGKNKVGTRYKLLVRRGDKYAVFKLCANYDGKIHGGMSYTWRYRVLDVSKDAALNKFQKCINGKSK